MDLFLAAESPVTRLIGVRFVSQKPFVAPLLSLAAPLAERYSRIALSVATPCGQKTIPALVRGE